MSKSEFRLLTVQEVAVILGLGRTKTYELMRSKGFPSMRLNNKLLVRDDLLDEWVRLYTGKQYNY